MADEAVIAETPVAPVSADAKATEITQAVQPEAAKAATEVQAPVVGEGVNPETAARVQGVTDTVAAVREGLDPDEKQVLDRTVTEQVVPAVEQGFLNKAGDAITGAQKQVE